MNCLLARGAVEANDEYPYGNFEMKIYKKATELNCEEFRKYVMGDPALLDRVLPRRP